MTTGLASTFLDESAAVPDLRANPLMLSLMCILYRGEGSLPRNRAEVYEQCSTLLFRKWDARRRIHSELRAGHHLEPALRHLAWWLFSRDQPQPIVTERELISETTAFLRVVGFENEVEAREAAAEFVSFCRGRMWVFSDTGTTRDGSRLYSFTHRTFLEFFAAAQLAYSCDTPEQLARILAPRAARQEWEVVSELALQIKDNTSNRGAQRIYATMLGERRRRTAAGRGGILQFLARCLRSVDPPPPTIRELCNEIFGRFFAGDANHPAVYEPVSWLLANCVNCADIVEHEFRSHLAVTISSDDSESRLRALNMLFFLTNSLDLQGDGVPHVPRNSAITQYWRECQDSYQAAHLSAIRVAAESDPGIRVTAHIHNLIELGCALEMHGGLGPFFEDMPIRIFGAFYTALLPSRISNLIAYPFASDHVLSQLTQLAHYLAAHPQPPWLHAPVSPWRSSNWPPIQESDGYPKLTEDQYLGAAVIMLLLIESMQEREMPNSFGPLSDLSPYVMLRWQREPDRPLPNLPISQNFQVLFHQWAANTVNFID